MPGRPRILSISFSHFPGDARVLRQLRLLQEFGEVTTVGYGDGPDGVAEHLEIDPSLPSLAQTPSGVLALALRRYRAVELSAPAVAAALRAIGGRRFDLVVANEARALPLAHAVAHGAPVWGDLHEWAPEERTHVLSWRLLVAPYMRWVCAEYLPPTAGVTTVNGSIAALYHDAFGVDVEVVRNAIPLQPLAPSTTPDDRIRLVHSGAAVPGRSIEVLIEATLRLDERFTLDLYLVQGRDGGAYWRQLRELARGSERIVFHDAVLPAELPATLNAYDVGVFVLPPRTANHRYMLPNKFFDFVQARLAIVFSTATETDSLIRRYGLGRISPGFTADDLAEALRTLDRGAIDRYKAATDAAAPTLSSAEDERVERDLIARLLRPSGPVGA
ncbi:glycosyltransferase family 4 protein [Agromyces binzhouensis]|uniref:glycosyltransferase family 4 protein n=1 Tax=Agromyces binzhouensis TaxID=1817495 RepID=UPI00362C5B98